MVFWGGGGGTRQEGGRVVIAFSQLGKSGQIIIDKNDIFVKRELELSVQCRNPI